MSSNDSDTDSIEKMYKNFGILADAKDKIAEHEEEYIEIIEAVKGSAKEKRLASQFIARFFKHFPKLYDRAIDALLDLCEDEDVAIRKQAIKDLPALCKDTKQFTHRISDILAQLLQAEDTTELSVAHLSLMSILRNDPKGALSGVFTQIMTGDDVVRERCIKFLVTKIKILGHEVVTKDVEDYIIAESKKVLQDVSSDEFASMMDILGWTRLGQSLSGQQELVDLVADQANLTQTFDPSDQENETVERLTQCLRHALPYFSTQVHSGRFVKYLCEEVLPKFSQFPAKEDLSELKLELLKIFAELSANCGTLDGVEKYVDKVFQQVVEYIPVQDVESEIEPRLEFSHIECLLFAYHRLLKQCPETLTKDAEVLKDFRFRLQYLARAIQGYIKKLREALQGKSGDELKTDENKMKVVALKTTSNINTLIKDLFHTPPIFKSVVSLSWKPAAPANSAAPPGGRKSDVSPGSKRHTPITFDNGSAPPAKTVKHDYNKSNRELYQPPSGKYSNRVSSYGNFPTQRGGRGRGRGNRRNNRGWQNRFY